MDVVDDFQTSSYFAHLLSKYDGGTCRFRQTPSACRNLAGTWRLEVAIIVYVTLICNTILASSKEMSSLEIADTIQNWHVPAGALISASASEALSFTFSHDKFRSAILNIQCSRRCRLGVPPLPPTSIR